jgi:hypothetical protein
VCSGVSVSMCECVGSESSVCQRVSARELVQRRVNAGSPGSRLISYLAVLFSSYGLGVEAVQGTVGSRLGALVPLAGQ